VLSKLGEDNGLSGYALAAAQTTGKPRGSALAASTIKQVEGGEALPKETWSHLAFTSDGKTLRLYDAALSQDAIRADRGVGL